MEEASIFDIQRFSLHDGPGIRTTIFFKGCTLSCLWCQNPESMSSKPELLFFEERCVGCGECVRACPNEVHKIINDKRYIFREKCKGCSKCVVECYYNALILCGRTLTADEVITEIKKDELFFRNSGGGVTFSGGEPLLQADFLLKVLKTCKSMNIHTTIETSGYAKFEDWECLLDYLDLVLFDLKIMDPKLHKTFTGSDIELILNNLKNIEHRKVPIKIRFPIIPKHNDSEINIRKTAKFVREMKLNVIELIPYNKMAESKWRHLNVEYKLKGLNSPTNKDMQRVSDIIESMDVYTYIYV